MKKTNASFRDICRHVRVHLDAVFGYINCLTFSVFIFLSVDSSAQMNGVAQPCSIWSGFEKRSLLTTHVVSTYLMALTLKCAVLRVYESENLFQRI